MNNKKGFTLIEVIVSIILVSVVLVSLLTTLVKLRESYDVVHENSDVLIYSSSVSRILNNDLIKNNGIRYLTCSSTGSECDLILGNDEKRKIEILTINDLKEETNQNKHKMNHENIKTTLKYTDTTKEDKLVYMKTLELDKYTDTVTKKVTTNGYNFLSMKSNLYEYGNDENETKDILTNINIGIYNGLDTNDKSYNIELYSSSRYDYDKIIGTTYKIEFNNNDADIVGTLGIEEEYGVGYFKRESAHKKSDIITSIDVPRKENKAFGGYYLNTGVGNEIIVVDSLGNIVSNNRLFKEDIDASNEYPVVKAKWEECTNGYYVTEKSICEPREYTITFDKQYGNGGIDNLKIKYKERLTKIEVPVKDRSDFLGYYTSIEGGEQYYDENGNPTKVIYDRTENITLYARWKASAYEVVYNGNSGTGSMEKSIFYYGDESKLKPSEYRKVGNSFLGWSTLKDATKAEYQDGATINPEKIQGDVLTLYAVWSPCAVNTYNDGTKLTCTACATGYTVASGEGIAASSCKMTVPAGKRVTAAGGAAENCDANTYSLQREINQTQTAACTACPAGYVVAAGAGTAQNKCYIAVSAGKYLTAANGTTVANCAANTYKAAHNVNYGSTDSCTACANGYTVAAGAGTAENTCKMTVPAGKRVTAAKGASENCAANTYSVQREINQTQTAACTPCPDGYIVAAGAGTAENKCYIAVPAGQYLTAAKGKTTANCAAGKYKAAHNVAYGSGDSCSDCGSGLWSTAGSSSCTTIGVNSSTVTCNATNTSNTAGKSMVYTGNCTFIDDGSGNYRIKFLTSGTLVLTRSITIDAFLVGGGASGCSWGGAGGGSGYTTTQKNKTINAGSYPITIGAGGAGVSYNGGGAPKAGGASTAFGFTANGGGAPGCNGPGGNGGSGGGGGGGGAGGSNGGNGGGGNGYAASRGQGTTTREFGESTGDLYAGGGGGGNSASSGRAGGAGGGGTGGYWSNGGSGTANTGGGGGGAGATGDYYSGAGGTGIVIIRNKR